jgi:hypothetical protein
MGSFARLSSAAAAAAAAAAPVAQSGGVGGDSGDLFLPEFSHAFDAVPAVPFAVRSTAAGEEKAHMPAPGRTGTQALAVAPTAVAGNIRTLRRIRHMRAALRAKVRGVSCGVVSCCVVSCCVCACAVVRVRTQLTVNGSTGGAGCRCGSGNAR